MTYRADLLSGAATVIMSRSLAAKVAPDGKLVLENSTLDVIAIDDSFGLGSAILADVSLAQRLLNMQGRLSYIAMFSERENLPKLKSQLDIFRDYAAKGQLWPTGSRPSADSADPQLSP